MEALNNTFAALFDQIVNPIVYIFSAVCFVWFLYGSISFLRARLNGKEEEIKSGKRNMLWGLVGLLIIFSASQIYNFIITLFN